jgi:putative SOS response-associated peptidase YedK
VSITAPEQLGEYFAVDEVRTESLGERYNVAPTLDVYSIIETKGTRRLGTLRWGFVPIFAKERKGRAPINARIETIDSNNMFRDAFRRHRCLLPADAFWEWQDRGEGRKKQPFHIAAPNGSPLALAGIWSVWRDPTEDDPEPLFSTAIVTTEARGRMEELHDRMPVIVPQNLWQDWLTADPADAPHLREAIEALGPPDLVATSVTGRVSNVRNEGPELAEPGTVDD